MCETPICIIKKKGEGERWHEAIWEIVETNIDLHSCRQTNELREKYAPVENNKYVENQDVGKAFGLETIAHTGICLLRLG